MPFAGDVWHGESPEKVLRMVEGVSEVADYIGDEGLWGGGGRVEGNFGRYFWA